MIKILTSSIDLYDIFYRKLICNINILDSSFLTIISTYKLDTFKNIDLDICDNIEDSNHIR